MDAYSDLIENLVTACHILDHQGVMDELGHFSVRCPDGSGILINGKVSPGQVSVEDIVLLDLSGTKLDGDREPASESPLHLAVYQRRPDVMAIAHTHSTMINILSIADIALRPVENQGASILSFKTPVFEHYGLIDCFDIAHGVADALGNHNICILKSHGNIVVGESIEKVCVDTIWAEKAASYQYHALLLGTPQYYPAKEIAKMVKQQQRGKGHIRTWNYYKWKLTQ